jgi:hypothetical protein
MQPLNEQISSAQLHPLAGDDPTLWAWVLDDFQEHLPNGTLTELVLAESEEAQETWERYSKRQQKGGDRAKANRILAQSILATVDLHRRGATAPVPDHQMSDVESELLTIAGSPYGQGQKRFLVKAYGLDAFEALALEGYTDANKDKKIVNGETNLRYMGENGAWGKHRTGWKALESALSKLPSLHELGIVLTTYRAPRVDKDGSGGEIAMIAALQVETVVKLGMRTMSMGQRHFLSTAVTYNGHWARAREVGGMIGVTGVSGRYINPLGIMGWVDGAEILYPPGVVTVFEGVRPEGYWEADKAYPVVHLREVSYVEDGQAVADDFQYELSRRRRYSLDADKLRLVQRLERLGGDRVGKAKEKCGLADRDVMYLTYDELRAVVKIARQQ